MTLILVAALSVLSLNMFLPALPAIAADLNTDIATASIAVSGYLAVTAFVHVMAGRLSDRFGRRPVLLAALGVFSCASLGCMLAPTIEVFLFFRLLQAGMASGAALSMAIVRDTTDARAAAGVIGSISMASALAPMLGPMVGGLIDTALGWRAIFAGYAITGGVLWVLAFVDVGETRPARSQDTPRQSLLAVARIRSFWAYALCTAFSTGGFFIFIAGAAVVAQESYGIGSAGVGVYIGSITGGFMVGAAISSRLAPRFALSTLMISGRCTAFGGLGMGLLLVAVGVDHPLAFFGSTIFVGLGNGLTMPSSNSGAMSAAPGMTGSAAGLNAAVNVMGGAILTSLTGGILLVSATPETMLILMLTSTGISLGAALWARQVERGTPVPRRAK